MAASTVIEYGYDVIDLDVASQTWENATSLEKVNTVLEVASIALSWAADLAANRSPILSGAAGLTSFNAALAVATLNITNTIEAIANYNQNPTAENYDAIVQSAGETLMGVGALVTSVGALAGVKPLVNWGLAIEAYGGLIQYLNTLPSEYPGFFDSFFDGLFSLRDFIIKYSPIGYMVDAISSLYYQQAKNWHPPRIDPLVLDLDKDGLELTAVSGKTLFDFDGDGIR
ncbi:MAG: hypothetical protein LBE24_04815, partial [Methylobacillus sp.]|nr:hypothetical protein [Methylobacillus sp.]